MTSAKNNKIVPFGKYKGQPIELMANDPQYVNWALAQESIRKRYPDFVNIIINNFQTPSETPEHNAMQVKFLDKNFASQFAITAHNITIPDTYTFHCEEPRFETKMGIDVSYKFILENPEKTRYRHQKYRHYYLYIEIKPIVSDDFPKVLRQMQLSQSNILYIKQYTGVGATEEQFIEYFKREKRKVIFDKNLDIIPF